MRKFTGGSRRESAMTLLEIMVVVAIIGMIAGLVGVMAMDRLQESRVVTTKVHIKALVEALRLFYYDNNFYPSTEQGLEALVTKPTTGRTPEKWAPNGYVEAVPRDLWGNEFQYFSPAPDGGDFLIVSFGRDGVEGGEGFDADITNHDLVDAASRP